MSSINENLIKEEVQIIEALANGQFIVERENNKNMRCYISGKMRQNKIKVIVGDKVIIVYPKNIKDSIGRIIFRKR